jgi:integrase
MEIHRILEEKVRLYRRKDSGTWHCATYFEGKEHRKSTKEKDLDRAISYAERWYSELSAKLNADPNETQPQKSSGKSTKESKTHKILNGKVQLFRRAEDGPWHCSASFGNSIQRRKSTKETSLALAKEVAEDWYLELKGKARSGELKKERTFAQAAKKFTEEYEAITKGHRSPKWVQGHKDRIRLHLLPYFGNTALSEISAGVSQEYRAHRMTEPEPNGSVEGDEVDQGAKPWKPPARNTIHNEIVTLSMILKTAHRHEWIEQVPDLSDPYRRQSKIEHRPWFTPNEYKQLYEATRQNAAEPKNPRYKWHAEQLHDFVLFMANTGLRPDEVKLLQFRDVEIVDDEYSGERILEIEVHGKRGTGYCKSMPGAVRPFERLLKRERPKTPIAENGETKEPQLSAPGPNDLLFPNEFKKMFNNLLLENDLKFDRRGKARTAYSLRHSYICFRLLEGADIYQIAKNCRTSVEMIEKHYAAHLKDMIDTSLVNVRKERPRRQTQPKTEEHSGTQLET